MMKTKMDENGKVEIPREVVDRLGLKAGSVFEIDATDFEITLKRAELPEGLEYNEHGVLVHTGVPTGDLTRVVEQDREERIRHISGMDSEKTTEKNES